MNKNWGIQESKNVKQEIEYLISCFSSNSDFLNASNFPPNNAAPQHATPVMVIDPYWDRVSQTLKSILIHLENQNIELRTKLNAAENRFAAVFHSSSHAIIVVDHDGSLRDSNSSFRQFCGLAADGIIAEQSLVNFFIKKDRKKIDRILKRLDEVDGADGMETAKATLISQQQMARWVELKFIRIAGQSEIIIFIQDLTERKKQDEEILRIKKELTILNSVARSVKQPKDFYHLLNLVLEKTGNFIHTEMGAIFLGDQYLKNLEPCVTIGMTHDEANRLLQANVSIIRQAKKQKTALFLNPANGFLKDLFVKQPKCRALAIVPLVIRKNKFGILALSSKKPITFDHEKKNFIAALGHQLSIHIENAILFKELEAKTQEVEAKNTELSSFVCTVSHDLKTPLIAFHGYLGLLSEQIQHKIDATATDYLNQARSSADYMEKMICDLLKLSRAGRVAGVKRRFSTYKLVDEIYMRLYPQMQQKKINFLSSKTLPVIYGDRQRFQIVFENLISNAINYASPKRSPQIEVSCQDRKNHFEFSIKDNGIGIDPENHQRIFEVFQKCATDENHRTGTGVGLTIVQKIVEHYGGKIWVDSRLDKGATFYFTIPRA